MDEKLLRWAADRGYRVAWGAAGVVRDARAEIDARRASAEITSGFFQAELEPMARREPSRGGNTVIVVAKPRPAHLVELELEGGRLDALLPPTYVRYRATFEEVRQDLAANALPGARVEHFAWPLKAVAARLGLVRYGLNNIAYAPGIGSYLQLCGYLTDARLPEREDAPAGPTLLVECESCGACASACPTGAIDPDRVLLRAERCLTLANENTGEWPGWVPPWAHHCLLGCLLCQRACPVNPELPIERTGLCFSAEETRALLDGGEGGGERPETGIGIKLAWLGQPYAEPVLGRNLRALVASQRAGRPRQGCG